MDKDEDFHVQKEEELQKMRKVRQNVIQEILVTEESYVNDLESCVDVFLQPKEEAKVAATVFFFPKFNLSYVWKLNICSKLLINKFLYPLCLANCSPVHLRHVNA